MFHQALTTLTLHHRATRFYLVWTPVDAELEGQRVARVIAAEACLQDPPEGLHKVQSAAYQKARAREWAFNKWEQDYHFDRARNALQLRATGLPLDGAAFTHAITTPPSGANHPLWKAAVAVETDEHGRKTRRPKYPRRVTSTALQLAIDHAFTGSYTARFRPSDPPDSLLCPCGAPLRTPQHLTLECRRFFQHRLDCGIYSFHRTLRYPQLYASVKDAHRLLAFLQSSHAAFRPETGPPIPPPPEPD
jgi:hypothetical protein